MCLIVQFPRLTYRAQVVGESSNSPVLFADSHITLTPHNTLVCTHLWVHLPLQGTQGQSQNRTWKTNWEQQTGKLGLWLDRDVEKLVRLSVYLDMVDPWHPCDHFFSSSICSWVSFKNVLCVCMCVHVCNPCLFTIGFCGSPRSSCLRARAFTCWVSSSTWMS